MRTFTSELNHLIVLSSVLQTLQNWMHNSQSRNPASSRDSHSVVSLSHVIRNCKVCNRAATWLLQLPLVLLRCCSASSGPKVSGCESEALRSVEGAGLRLRMRKQ